MAKRSINFSATALCLITAALLLIGTASAAAPEAAFTGTPTSGIAPLTVDFTDVSAGGPTGWAWFFGDETYGDAWTNQTAASGVAPGWTAREYHTSVALPNGSIVLMGGRDGSDYQNDTWRSDDGGETWTRVAEHAGWTTRLNCAAVAMSDGSIILMGGEYGPACLNDTWRSTDSGSTWTNQTAEPGADAGWTARLGHTSVAMPDGSIILMGGSDGNDCINDVWRSTDNGTTWARVTEHAGWAARYGHTSVVMPDGSIVLMGGSDDSVSFNDVWRSTNNGVTWTNITLSDGNPWEARSGHASVAMPDGSILLMGGWDNTGWFGDMWRSTDNGTTWTQLPDAGCVAGVYYTVVAVPDGSVVLMGGRDDHYNRVNYTWRLQPAGSTAENPSHEYDTPGTYSVALQVYNADGYNATRAIGYITVSAAPVPPVTDFTGTPTSGTAPLTVDFTDASAGTPTGWAWFFGDETYGEAWTEVNGSAEWGQRVGHTSVTLPDGSIVFMGGQNMMAIQQNDVWRSTNNGATWTRVTEHVGWPARSYYSSVALPDGSVVLMGGTGGGLKKNDVWRSTDNGTTWIRQIEHAGWAARSNHASVALSNGGIVLMGGEGATALDDVWRSTDNGTTWTRVTEHAGWSARTGHSSLTMPDGSIVLAGGMDTTFRNDVWRSTDNGATWTCVNASAGWPARGWHASVVTRDGSILVMGGSGGGFPRSDAWRLQPAGSTTENPSHEYDTPGTYTVALQVYNADGYDSMPKTGYITVTGPTPTPAPTQRPVYSGGGGGGSTAGPGGYNVGGDSVVSKVTVTGTGIETLIVTGWKQSSPGAGIPPAPGTPYQYVDLVPARFEEITGANITFTVSTAWLAEHGFAPEEIVLYHYNGTAWEALPTWIVDATGTSVTFRAATPGFSLFAISGIEQAGEATTPTAAQTTVQAAAEPTATETAAAPAGEPAPEFPLGTVALAGGFVLVLAGAGYLIRRWWIRRQNPALFRDYD